jgi:Phosphoenolpyruvate synthase/pyruvate phosphate dikinase
MLLPEFVPRRDIEDLKELMPEVYKQFQETAERLENHYRDMQDIEFTIEKSKLFMLQTRTGKRTAAAALCAAVEMVEEGLITKEEAVLRLDPISLDQLLHPTFEEAALKAAELLATGLPASPGAATGKVYFTAEAVCAAVANGEETLLVRKETSPEDIEGMYAANGILTARGGMTSHAAVVARGMGKCCVAGCEAIKVDEAAKQFTVGNQVFTEGDFISLNGSTGSVYKGSIKTVTPELSGHFAEIMAWADEYRTLKVRTNADTPNDAAVAVRFGAEGIGLCRTEHMFFDEQRLPSVRRMILSESKQQREKALAEILPMQKEILLVFIRQWKNARLPFGYLIRLFTNSCRKKARILKPWRLIWALLWKIWLRSFRVWKNLIRCWVIAVAVWRLPIPKLHRCKLGQLWKLPLKSSKNVVLMLFPKL